MTVTFQVPKILTNKIAWSIFCLVLVFFGLTAGSTSCSGPTDNVAPNQASSPYTFVDVTGSGACTLQLNSAAGDGNCGTSSPLTFWYDQGNEHLIICSHLEDQNQYMSNFAGCDYYQPPVQLPPGSIFIAVNQGAMEIAQTAWQDPSGHYWLCEHDYLSWFNTNLITATNCSHFSVPSALASTASLASFNSGLQITSSEFWYVGGRLMECDVAPFRLPDGYIRPFNPANRVKSCYPFPTMPGDGDWPGGASNETFIGINSDQALPWEVFFSAKYNGAGYYVIRCTYNNSNPGWSDINIFSNYEEKMTNLKDGCNWWFGLQPQMLPPLPAAA